jgi:serine/threonine-protein kinase
VPDEDSPEEIVKVLDFGIAKILDGAQLESQTLTARGTVVGTIHYLSPEQARASRTIDHRADLWSLAILAFQCVTGVLPVSTRSIVDLLIALTSDPMPVPSAVLPGVPAAFDAWFAKATRRSPDDRFQSAAEMAEELARALGPA